MLRQRPQFIGLSSWPGLPGSSQTQTDWRRQPTRLCGKHHHYLHAYAEQQNGLPNSYQTEKTAVGEPRKFKVLSGKVAFQQV